MSSKAKKIKEFISVTGADKDSAKHFLEACSGNLETAVAMYLDRKQDSEKTGCTSKSPEDKVRAPIPQTSGVLVDDPHYATTSRDRWSSRRRARTVFDGFRDFKSEIDQQEKLLSGDKRLKRLEDLFRPPLDLMHRGTFETARESGKSANKWLMVNVQNVKEFCCQVLNRDVWSKPSVKSQIRKNFVFWQVYSDSTEGDRFMTFYPVNSWPHVSILDPRTGERLACWTDINSNNIIGKIQEFLADHGVMGEEEAEPPNKKSKVEYSVIDDSEDSQMAAAIAASLKESKAKPDFEDDINSSDADDNSDFEASDDDVTNVTPKSNGCKISSETNLVEDPPQNPPISSNLTNTHVEEDFFSGKSRKCVKNAQTKSRSENSTLLDRPTSDVTLPKKCEKEKVYKKIKPFKKNGSMNNGGDSSSMASKEYVNRQEVGQPGSQSQNKELCWIMARFPDGSREQIEMPKLATVKDLAHTVALKGYSAEDFEIVTHFPKQNISKYSLERTLEDTGLCPRATVFIQERED